jgi:hypothetical protein
MIRMLAVATDLKRWKKVFHAAISSTALNFPVKTTERVAYEAETFRDTWNRTAKIIEAITGKSFARVVAMEGEQFRIKAPPGEEWETAFDLLGELAQRPETSDDLRWRLNWMRDTMFALGLSPERIEHEARSGKGLWWGVLRKRKENIAVLDAKNQWDRLQELGEDQREERQKHERKHIKGRIVESKDGRKFLRYEEVDCPDRAFSTRNIHHGLMKPPPGHRTPTVWKRHKGLGLRDYTEPVRLKLKSGRLELIFRQKGSLAVTRPLAEFLIRHWEFLPSALQRALESIGRYYKIDTRPNFKGPSAPGPFGDPHDGTAIFHRSGRVRKGMEEAAARLGIPGAEDKRQKDLNISTRDLLDVRDKDEAPLKPVKMDSKID